MKRTSLALALLVLTSGCMGTRLPKLARCTGPYRYANPNGTVLPSLPIPGQPQAAATPPPAAAPSPPPAAAPVPQPSPGTDAPAADAKPPKTSALPSHYPSC